MHWWWTSWNTPSPLASSIPLLSFTTTIFWHSWTFRTPIPTRRSFVRVQRWRRYAWTPSSPSTTLGVWMRRVPAIVSAGRDMSSGCVALPLTLLTFQPVFLILYTLFHMRAKT
ncbi:hypothetical protein M011DRAFT_124720 [Sporormia fimetaria CBS 119925]|uniref:Uncharacterized protein n=1 Tax=Sporormia fimetaria CBS 119925 TaxID=1340428 RepID=A0A6A6V824_9PLEO|nr:hypothetical protein M011DRAFT_124720 [Sporormia fimetaria CBS 119925]